MCCKAAMSPKRQPAEADEPTIKAGHALGEPRRPDGDATTPQGSALAFTSGEVTKDGPALPLPPPGPRKRTVVAVAPPEATAGVSLPAEAVATRALAVAALVQRGLLEGRSGEAGAVRALQRWAVGAGILSGLGLDALALFEAPFGHWSRGDTEAVGWLAEELRLLFFVLGLEAGLPSTFERSDAGALLASTPLLGDARVFLERATVRPLSGLARLRTFYEAVHYAVQLEVWARAVLAEGALARDEAVRAAVAEAVAAGFDVARVTDRSGLAVATAEGLRLAAHRRLEALFASGSPHARLAFSPTALLEMTEHALGNALAVSRTRARALSWLTSGG